MGVLEKVDKSSFVITPTPTREERAASYSAGRSSLTLVSDNDIRRKTMSLQSDLQQIEVRFKNLSLTADLGSTQRDWSQPKESDSIMKKMFGKKHSVRKHILQDISGSFRPGVVTLLLGQSGSGKSAFMKVLSGRFPMHHEISMEGKIAYNGVLHDKLLNRLPQFVNYVTQTETHLPTLTVRETLEFAHECCGSSAENAIPGGVAQAHYPDVVLNALGLDNCQHTIVGNGMHRGISGGEKRRVTTGEMEFGMKYVTMMDEITTGLDSAAAFDIIVAQRNLAKQMNKTVVISLLQPSPEIFSLFDDVVVLNEGRVIYHGSTRQVQGYFESLGFICPPERDLADFLCDLATPQQIQYQVKVSQEGHKVHPRDAGEFADLWARSTLFQQLEAEADSRESKEMVANADGFMEAVPEFHQGFWASTWALTKRQMILMKRDPACLQGRAILVIVVGFLFASLFYQFDLNDMQMTMGVIYASVLSQGLGQVAWIVTFYDARIVFYKQRAANFFRTSSYVVATMLVQFPLAVMETIVFGSLVYWAGGFVYELGAFLVFELFLLLILLVFLSLVFFLAAASPNLSIAEPAAMVCVLFYVLFAGFIVSKNQIPNWLIWLYWIDPVAWTVRSIAVSQYRHPELDVCDYKAFDYCTTYNQTMGEFSLSLFDVPTEKYWIVYGIVFLITVYLGFTVLAYFVLEYYRFDRPEKVMLPVEPKRHFSDKDWKANTDDLEENAFNLIASPCASDVGISGNDARIETVIRMDKVARQKQLEPVTVAFKDLWYTVSAPGGPGQPAQSLDLLKGITGYALPGTITALMGSTGAGKTTLMDVIAGRKTGGTIRGQILLNGFEASDLSIRRCTGYCEQTDIHSKASTFREALTFSAFLRQGADVPDSEKYDTVDECLELLDLDGIADHMIRGSSMEKMKRLTIGVEMAAQPSVLFLDEPTSGLDARSAKVIMNGVRKVANSGRTVLCTIHQPSSDVFHMFDALLLLKKGGETVYFGELGVEAQTMVDYFQSIPSVPRINGGYNPATWMLEVIGAGVAERGEKQPTDDIDFVDIFSQSAIKRLLDSKLMESGLFQPSEQYKAVKYGKKRAARNITQLRFLLHRFFITYWRTPSYNLTRLGISVLLGFAFGFLFSDADYTTYQGINSGLGLIFLSTVFVGLVALISVLPLAYEERATFYRERSSQMYNTLWYFVSFSAVEIPNVFVCAFLFTAVYYPMVGFSGFSHAIFYWINVALMIIFESYLGQFCIFAAPSIEVASIIGMQINAISFMLMGFNPPANQIPSGYKWLYTISPHRYSFAALTGTVFSECSVDQLAEIRLATTSAATESMANTTVSAAAVSTASASFTSLTSPASDTMLSSLDISKYPLGCQMLKNAPPNIGSIPIQTYVDQVFGVVYGETLQSFGVFVGMITLLGLLALVAMRYSNHQQR
ncbi:unnamed protein product [Phytophthora fragariaefolia]|uniref:Unnamed protein product n=1 Tax=Phytophthora fragariaefolia TaxID=1490495 RepID=A0A9W6Y2Y7_9STRA|nr:unnamed protein product [Phytophthora fragariaefolia]